MIDSEGPRIGSLNGLALTLSRQWWPQVVALAAACGVVAITITGALAVGSSLQRSLQSLALERLGRIDGAVLSDSFLTTPFVDQLIDAAVDDGPMHVVPAIILPVTVSTGGGRTAAATLLACDDPAALGYEPGPPPLDPNALLANSPLAETLGLTVGDAVVLRLPRRSTVPADSPLGRRSGSSDGRRLTVDAILPDRGLARFSLRPEQSTQPLVVTSLAAARRILRLDDAFNCVFAVAMPPGRDASDWMLSRMKPTLADYGLAFEPVSSDPPCLRLTAARLILPPEAEATARAVLGPLGGHPTLVMLANTLVVGNSESGSARVPYSTVLGIDTTSLPVGDLIDDDEGALLPLPGDDGIIIDRWLADDFAAQGRPVAIGDQIAVTLFEPETVHGRIVEVTAHLRITGIAAMHGAATSRDVVPDVEGVTDEDSIADWDPPFPFDAARVRSTPPNDQDDRYWKEYGPSPKAFVSLATARRLAGSRFGNSTAWLVPSAQVEDPSATAMVMASRMLPEPMGLHVTALRKDALKASRGSTPFGSLFLALSSFALASGLLLEWLLFGLLVSAHRRDVGILAAVGFSPRRLMQLLLSIGGVAAAIGAIAGMILGPVWARGLLAILGRQWAVNVDPGSAAAFAFQSPEPSALATGAMAALVVSLLALASAARRASRLPPLALLRETTHRLESNSWRRRGITAVVAAGGIILALATAWQGRAGAAEAAVGLFFASGASALAGALAFLWLWLSRRSSITPVRTLVGLACRNLGFAPGRAFSVAAIVAVATFLVVAVSSFAQRMPEDLTDRGGPTGGWTDMVSFGEATSVDPTDPAVRSALGISSSQEELIASCDITRLRTSGGDDAACTNLYATLRPTVLGVSPRFITRGGFRFTDHAPLDSPATNRADVNPWKLLEGERDAGKPIPAILDQATAQWGLRLGGIGSRFQLEDDAGNAVTLEIVGLLEPGVLQGYVIVSERDFERMLPGRSGYGMALIDASRVPEGLRHAVPSALASSWADASPTVTPTRRRLASLQAVQNTFLGGFQAIGSLGLLLGTAGVAAVQAQGMLERLGQLAVLRAIGFTLARLRLMLVFETLAMVGIGLTVGAASACLAVMPAISDGHARLSLAWIAVVGCGSLAAAVVASTVAATRHIVPVRPRAE